MKGKKRRGIMVLPPGSGKIRTIHVPKSFLIIFVCLIILGFAGYFIPFNSFTLDVIETNQKRNLDDQNKSLLQSIRPMRRYLENLSEEIEKLERKKQKITRVLGGEQALAHDEKPAESKKNTMLSLDELVAIISRDHDLFSKVTQSNVETPEKKYFDAIPVIFPLRGDPLISTRYGRERDPFTQYEKFHYGIDLIAGRGVAVIATAMGVVSKIEDSHVWGRRIFITHSSGFSTVYAHLGTIDVGTGKKVNKGDRIGTVGLSGLTTGMHVHYEVWHNGRPENPEDFIFPSTILADAKPE
jgi:murein DD-endopeptidase MepM/ murein hydrolase activator NlpD